MLLKSKGLRIAASLRVLANPADLSAGFVVSGSDERGGSATGRHGHGTAIRPRKPVYRERPYDRGVDDGHDERL
jgi:hypothetical protein